MRILLRALAPLALCLPVLAGPVYYQYNLAAAGVANADSDISQSSPAWTGIWGGQSFSKGNVSVNVGSKITNNPALAADPRLAAVPFSIATTGEESWSGYKAWQALNTPDRTAPTGVTIAANGQKAEMVFLMLNTFWGSAGGGGVNVTLAFQSGTQLTFSLVGDTDVRDHHDSAVALGYKVWSDQINTNVRTNGNGTSQVTVNEFTNNFVQDGVPHEVYRDVISLILPPAYWNELLSSIYVADLGRNNVNGNVGDPTASRVWLWGVTTLSVPDAVPEPSTWLMVGGGLAVAGWLGRRRRP